MRDLMRWASGGLLSLLLLAGSANADSKPAKAKADEDCGCGDYGTTVRFEKSPSDAAKKAHKEEKLVMVLHISGHFEEPDFT